MPTLAKNDNPIILPERLHGEEMEHWIYRNRNILFKMHLDNEGLTWRDIAKKTSIIFDISPAINVTDFLKVINTGLWIKINKTPVFSR